MPKFFILFALTVLAGLQANALRIQGSAPDYAGKMLEFFSVSDPVSLSPVPCFVLKIDEKGHFSVDAEVRDLLYCYSDFGIYRGRMIMVPGKDINLELPPIREKRFEESKNPYFEPVLIWLKTDAGDNSPLNTLVSRFDARYYILTDAWFNQLYYRQMKNYADSVKIRLDKEFRQYDDPAFRMHRQLRIKSLEADIQRAGREKVAGSLRDVPPQMWNQPAFSDFLNRLFVNTLSTESKSPGGSKLRLWVARENLAELSRWVRNFTASEAPLSDLILLKMLHDAFYSGEFSKPAILKMVGSPWFSQNSQPRIREVASAVLEKLNFLRKGSPAPGICLPSVTGKVWCSTSNTKPWLYILFADLEIPVCREQVKYLKTMAEKTGQEVQVLVVVSPAEKINVTEFMSQNQIPGLVVLDQPENSAGRLYKVRSYPSAFLLDRQQKVVLAPARTPLDGFEFQFEDMKK